MSTITAPAPLFEAAEAHTAGLDGGRPTLEERLESVWEGLSAAGAAPCPLCGGRMQREIDAARCGGCGSTLT